MDNTQGFPMDSPPSICCGSIDLGMWYIDAHWQLHMDTATSAQVYVTPTTNCVFQQRVAPVSPLIRYPRFPCKVLNCEYGTPIHDFLKNRAPYSFGPLFIPL